ncbi:hypothetical protein RN001_005311 [Aquatica leii]|uniref:Uncharacterized protein n=1 Tax=Aquatica leii TaxID=1421715 RepID=A0AAN7Q113_9COLE|nr:hypothetical protein RN001_005311 [Aquatica leii]
MYFKVVVICFLAFASAKAGFLHHGQNIGNIGNIGNNGHPGGDVSNGGFGFQQQVPLTLNPGPIPQNNAAPNPHSGSVLQSSFAGQPASQSQTQASYNGPAATSSSFRQQHVNSVPTPITSQELATGFVPVPSHGYFGINAGGNANPNGNSNNNNNNNNNAPNNALGNNGGAGQGSYGYGSYGYAFSSAGGNPAGNSEEKTNEKENISYSKNNKITILSNIVLKEPITNDHIDDDASIQRNDEPYQSSSSEYVSSSYSSSHKGDEDDYANLRKELILANSTLCDEPSTKMLPNLPVSPVELACQLQEVPKSMKSPVFPLQICDKFQIPDNSSDSEIETTAYVNRAKKTISGSRVYDKRHACYFCDKLIGIVTRHLELVHFKEIEVAKLLTMDKNSERRIEGFLCLLRAGDYYDNCQILAMKKEEKTNEKENTSYSKNNKITILSNIVLKEPITNDDIDDDASIQSNDEPYQSSSSEYVPSSYSSSHEGDEDDYANLRKEFQIPDNSSDSEIETTAYVNRAKKTISGSRVYDKRHACYFCDKLIGTVTRHLELVHFKGIEVAKLLTMNKNSERQKEGENLVNCCDDGNTNEIDKAPSGEQLSIVNKVSSFKITEVEYFKDIIKQKNHTISYLEDTVSALKKQIKLLNFVKDLVINNKVVSSNENTKQNSKSQVNKMHASDECNRISTFASIATKQTNSSEDKIIVKKVMTKMESKINNEKKSKTVSSPTATRTTGTKNDADWITVGPKKQNRSRKELIIGTKKVQNENAGGIKAAPKTSLLHISRLSPNTSETELII